VISVDFIDMHDYIVWGKWVFSENINTVYILLSAAATQTY